MPFNVARTAFIASLAAALFGLFLLVAPRLTATGSADAPPTTTSTTLTAAPVIPPATTTTTTMPATTTTLWLIPGEWDPEGMTAPNGYDGTIRLAVNLASAPAANEDTAVWELRVANTSESNLWGLFAYVEGFGRADCDVRRPAPLSTAVCRVEGTAYTGTWPVVAWVNAWTETQQVKDMVLVELVVP